ncbi:MAG: ATP-binding protein [Chlamydiae bacterium]|nr:ATP-binding protein [Chlamydiota bacterium]
MIERTLIHPLIEIIQTYGKMGFVSGPRQVGKTTLAQAYRKRFGQSLYFNWDLIPDQKKLLENPYFFENENRNPQQSFLVVLDEIHKYARWKNYLKGAYDHSKDEFRFLITGSGRLDLFKKGGDSLLGRYMSVPLFPLSVGEIQGRLNPWKAFKEGIQNLSPLLKETEEIYDQLFHFSGFPEPFVRSTSRFYQMWFQERKSLLLREDIRDATRIREISLLEMLSHLLPERVGSPLSINQLKQDIKISFETVRDWITILENFFYLFKITPFTGSLKRSLRKEPKIYLYDWVEVPQEGYQFENVVALHLFKAVELWKATGEGNISLHYLRDKEKREVDFVIAEKNRPICLIECKTSDGPLSPSLLYFQKQMSIDVAIQIVHQKGIFKKTRENGELQWIVSAHHLLSLLP